MPLEEAWKDEVQLSDALRRKIFIKHFDGPIFFGFSSKFLALTRALPEIDVVIMRMKRVPYIDQSGLYAIEDALLTLQDKNVLVLMTGLQEQPRDMLEKVGVIPNLVPEENLYPDFQSAIKALETGRAGYRQDKLAGTG